MAITGGETIGTRLSTRLHELGIRPLIFPAIATELLDQPGHGRLADSLAVLERYDWVIFTSTTAVRVTLIHLGSTSLGSTRRDDPRAGISLTETSPTETSPTAARAALMAPETLRRLTGRRIAAVGSATAAYLAQHGVREAVVPAVARAAAIPDALGDIRGSRILLPRGDLAGQELPAALRARGASVDDVIAYQTVPGPGCRPLAELVRDRGVDAITFASGSAVRYFADTARDIPGVTATLAPDVSDRPRIVCIGPATAAAARDLGLAVDAVAGEHDADGLARAVSACLGGDTTGD